MLVRPIVIETNSDDGQGNRFYQKKVIVKGVGSLNAGVNPLDEFLDTFDREYNEDMKREESLAEQRRLTRIGQSLQHENNLIGDILGMVERNQNYDLPEAIGLVNPLPLSFREAAQHPSSAQIVKDNEQPASRSTTTEEESSAEDSDAYVVDSILRSIFGKKGDEAQGKRKFS
jgi:hypothetical protein